MHTLLSRVPHARLLTAALAVAALAFATPSSAVVLSYVVTFSGAAESPPNASPGTGSATVDIDTGLHTMSINATFTGLLGNTSAAHIHAATAVAGTGTAGVATTTPNFSGFPLGVTSGAYANVLDLLNASSYNPAYITAHGGTAASAEVDLLAAIAAGKAYFNIHSSVVPGGEIRGFLLPAPTVPATPESWGRIKNTYR